MGCTGLPWSLPTLATATPPGLASSAQWSPPPNQPKESCRYTAHGPTEVNPHAQGCQQGLAHRVNHHFHPSIHICSIDCSTAAVTGRSTYCDTGRCLQPALASEYRVACTACHGTHNHAVPGSRRSSIPTARFATWLHLTHTRGSRALPPTSFGQNCSQHHARQDMNPHMVMALAHLMPPRRGLPPLPVLA